MVSSKAKTIPEYLASLPADRRAEIEKVRDVVNRHLPAGYEEGMQYGGIGYYVPHSKYPHGYHCDPKQPLPFAGLGSQKNHISLGIMSTYMDGAEGKRFREEWLKTGKKLDMGKSCIRFKKADDLALDVIGEAIARVGVDEYVAHYLRIKGARDSRRAAPARRSPPPKKAAARRRRPAGTRAPSARRRAR